MISNMAPFSSPQPWSTRLSTENTEEVDMLRYLHLLLLDLDLQGFLQSFLVKMKSTCNLFLWSNLIFFSSTLTYKVFFRVSWWRWSRHVTYFSGVTLSSSPWPWPTRFSSEFSGEDEVDILLFLLVGGGEGQISKEENCCREV